MNVDPDSPKVQARQRLHAAIKDAIEDDPYGGEPGMLKAWVCVYDVVQPDDSRAIFVYSSNAMGEVDLVPWERDGLLHYALYDFQADDEDDDG